MNNIETKRAAKAFAEVRKDDSLAETPLGRALRMMPKKLNVKPEKTYKFNPHLPGTKL